MVVVSTVCPLDLSSQDQLMKIACEARHLMGDYTDAILLKRLEELREAALALRQHWIDRHAPKPPIEPMPVKATKRKAVKRPPLDA